MCSFVKRKINSTHSSDALIKVKWSIAFSDNHLTATGNHGITQCYLPPGSGDFPALP